MSVLFILLCLLISGCRFLSVPLKTPPEALTPGYTYNGTIPLEFFYVDDTLKGAKTHYIFLEEEIEQYIVGARKIIQRFQTLQTQVFRAPKEVILPWQAASIILHRLPKSQWVQFGLYSCRNYIENKKIAIIGSMEPWIESFVLALGAQEVITIEYNKLTYSHPKIRTFSEVDFDRLYKLCDDRGDKNTADECHLHSFDFIVSPSAFDHDGLGRYGDPLNPLGDIEAMEKMKILLRPHGQGYLFLTVPIGPDVTVFNLHRRYGPIRLPLLLSNWTEVARLGWQEEQFTKEADWKQTYEPIFILAPSEEGDNSSVENKSELDMKVEL